MTAPIERYRRLFDDLVCGCGSHRQETRADPLDQMVAGDIVTGHDENPFAASGPDPVFSDSDCLGGGCARSVQLRIRTAGADVFGHLGVTHRHALEEESPIERVGLGLEMVFQLVDPMLELLRQEVAAAELAEPCLQGLVVLESLLDDLGLVELLDLLHGPVEAGEC